MWESRHSRLHRPAITGGEASPKRPKSAINRSTARKLFEETIQQVVQPIKQDSEKLDTLNMLVDRVVSDKLPAFGKHVEKKE